MSWTTVAWIVAVAVLGAAVAVAWHAWRSWMQLCPHCAWVVRRVEHGWLRCPRCHKQYGRPGRHRPHR